MFFFQKYAIKNVPLKTKKNKFKNLKNGTQKR